MKYAIRVLEEALSGLNDMAAYFKVENGQNINVLPKMKNDIANAISILNGNILESEKSVCPLCKSDDVFDTELRIYKCRSCDARWTN